MNRPEDSLSLDSVICRRCNAVSGAGENTCPYCGADRQGAIFTSRADATARAPLAANDDQAMTPQQRELMERRNNSWLTRHMRRKMVMAYPRMAGPGDSPPAPPRRPARTGIAILVGIAFVGLAAGVYQYVDSDDESDPMDGRLAVSAAGAVRDGPASHDDRETNVGPARTAIDEKPGTAGVPVATAPATDAAPLVRRTERASSTPREVAASGPVIAAVTPPASAVAIAGAVTGLSPLLVPSLSPSITPPSIAAASAPKPSTFDATESATQPATPSDKPNTPPIQTAARKDKPGAHNIAPLQQALASHDLASARRQLRALPASQRRNPEVQRLAADLTRQERERDRAIASARACAASKDPACAVRNARRAVALDPQNAQAQASLRRALAVQAQSNADYFRQAGVIPKPVVPAMTFDGRWSAAPKHASSAEQSGAARGGFLGWGVPTVAKGRGDAH